MTPAPAKYMRRRTGQGLSKKEIMRCLKRYVAREVYRVLTASTSSPPPSAARP
jgi:transposase